MAAEFLSSNLCAIYMKKDSFWHRKRTKYGSRCPDTISDSYFHGNDRKGRFSKLSNDQRREDKIHADGKN
jgi:hypothetical protein